MSAESMVGTALDTVPKAVAAGVVDMESGMLLSIKTVDSHPQAVLDMLAAATKEMFQGEMVTQIEDTFRQQRGEKKSNEHYFREIVVTSKNLIHVFARLPTNEQAVLGVVTRHDANLGMVLTKARTVAEQEGL